MALSFLGEKKSEDQKKNRKKKRKGMDSWTFGYGICMDAMILYGTCMDISCSNSRV